MTDGPLDWPGAPAAGWAPPPCADAGRRGNPGGGLPSAVPQWEVTARGNGPRRDEQRAHIVDPMRTAHYRQARERPGADIERQQAQRHIDPEDQGPGETLGKETAQHRPRDARQRIDRGKESLIAAALPWRD